MNPPTLLVLAVISFPVSAVERLGEMVPPYPDSLSSRHGACIGGQLKSDPTCAYAVGMVEGDDGRYTHLTLKKFKEKAADGVSPVWIIQDVMEYPKLQKPYFLATAVCRFNKESDPAILAVVEASDTELYTNIKFAYRANLVTGKFEIIASDGIDCWNEGWGL